MRGSENASPACPAVDFRKRVYCSDSTPAYSGGQWNRNSSALFFAIYFDPFSNGEPASGFSAFPQRNEPGIFSNCRAGVFADHNQVWGCPQHRRGAAFPDPRGVLLPLVPAGLEPEREEPVYPLSPRAGFL